MVKRAAPWLRDLAAFAEEMDLVPSTQQELPARSNSNSRGSDALLWRP